jgi:hypothetical protein
MDNTKLTPEEIQAEWDNIYFTRTEGADNPPADLRAIASREADDHIQKILVDGWDV